MSITSVTRNYVPSLQVRAAAELERRRRARVQSLTFRGFIRQAYPRFQFYRHLDKLIDLLQQVADGDIRRLMVFMPPRHGKSELVSRLFPAYYLHRHPHRFVGINSYAAELAYSLSRNARRYYRESGGPLSEEAAAAKHWETGRGGGLWAAGVGGPITGKGFDLGIVDDPLKNFDEASSPTIRRKQQDWYASTFYTRQEPGGAIVVIQTRWHEEDLSGWLLGQEEAGEAPERWHIVNYEAVKSSKAPSLPATCTVEPDWRGIGEALCPERYPIDRLQRTRKRIGTYFFAALYQQRPAAAEGNIVKRQWWRFWRPRDRDDLPPVRVQLADGSTHECELEPLPPLAEHIQSWDMAFKDKATSSFVVGQIWGRSGANKYLLDQDRGRRDLPATLAAVRDLSEAWPEARLKLVEDKANGPAVIQTLRYELAGLVAVSPDGSKEARVHAVSPEIESGNVYLPHPQICPWVWDFVEEWSTFPAAANDDQVDAGSQALLRLTQPQGRRRKRSREY